MKMIATILLAFLMVSCSNQEVLTEKERAKQLSIDNLVSETLFQNNLEEDASYHIDGKGHVQINFEPLVPTSLSDRIVHQLRAEPLIKSVTAKQNGQTICPLN